MEPCWISYAFFAHNRLRLTEIEKNGLISASHPHLMYWAWHSQSTLPLQLQSLFTFCVCCFVYPHSPKSSRINCWCVWQKLWSGLHFLFWCVTSQIWDRLQKTNSFHDFNQANAILNHDICKSRLFYYGHCMGLSKKASNPPYQIDLCAKWRLRMHAIQ